MSAPNDDPNDRPLSAPQGKGEGAPKKIRDVGAPTGDFPAVDAERKQARKTGFIVLGVLCVLMPTLWVVATLRQHAAATDGALKTAQTEKERAGAVEYQNEIVIVPANAARPTRHDVAFSIGAILKEAKACMEGFTGTAFVSWQVNPDGSASEIQFITPPNGLNAGPLLENSCLPETVAKARVAPFDGAPVRVTYPFRRLN